MKYITMIVLLLALVAQPMLATTQDTMQMNQVRIVEYGDFECPFCKRFYDQTYPQIIDEYGADVRFEFKHFPLEFHPHAHKAAQASECARDQGMFWEYHDVLYETHELTTVDLKKHAMDLGLDTVEFNECLDNNRKLDFIDAQIRGGKAEGVTGTPTFFINGEKIVGAQPYEVFEQAIDDALSDDKYMLREGQTKVYTINGQSYELTLLFVSDPCTDTRRCPAPEAKFSANGEISDTLNIGEEYEFTNGLVLVVRDMDSSSREGWVAFKLDVNEHDGDYTLREGETEVYDLGRSEYELTLVYVSDPCTEGTRCAAPNAKFSANGELSPSLEKGKRYAFENGLILEVDDILVNARQGVVYFNLETHVPSGDNPLEGNFHIVVGTTAPTSDVIDAIDLAKAVQSDDVARPTSDEINPIAVGVALLDENAYKAAVAYNEDFEDNVIVVIHKRHALVVYGDELNSEQERIFKVSLSHLESKDFDIIQQQGSPRLQKYMLVENMITMFDDKLTCWYKGEEYEDGEWVEEDTCRCVEGLVACVVPQPTIYDCTYNGKYYDRGESFPARDGCNTCTCSSDGTVACTERACVPTDCIQVITPARDPESGRCKEFATPCDVPEGWKRVDSCILPNENECSDGCSREGRCLPYGTRVANGHAEYCDISGEFTIQKTDEQSCQNHYECASNQCLNAVCTSLEKEVRESNSIVRRIWEFLSNIF